MVGSEMKYPYMYKDDTIERKPLGKVNSGHRNGQQNFEEDIFSSRYLLLCDYSFSLKLYVRRFFMRFMRMIPLDLKRMRLKSL